MAKWEYLTYTVRGRLLRGPLRAQHLQQALERAAAEDWDLVSAIPVTELGFTSAVWVVFRRPAGD